jgi:hypothetical protein
MIAELKRTQRDICPICTMPFWKRLVVIHHRDCYSAWNKDPVGGVIGV